MNLPLRRTLSWLATLGVVASIALALRALPGWNGVAGELGWLLANNPRTREFNRAAHLLISVGDASPQRAAAFVASLLNDSSPSVVEAMLQLLYDTTLPYPRRGSWPLHEALKLQFQAWLSQASDEVKLVHCERASPIARFGLVDPPEFTLTASDLGWLVAATLPVTEESANILLSLEYNHGAWLAIRVLVFDGLAASAPDQFEDPVRLQRHDEIVALLRASHPRVRWAAARILAVCRDERALPTVVDWLRNDPKAPQSAHRVLAELFGPDWRKPFENGAAETSQLRVP